MTPSDCTVHVVDDDASWRTSVRRLLSAAGYQVVLYESAEDFLAKADLSAPGCILLDVRMPGLTGLQLQNRLAELGRRLPVVFISGHGDIPTSVRAMKGGADDFLTKPVDTDVLLDAISRAIARSRKEQESRARLDALQVRVDALTPTERKVFALVTLGRLNKHIAAELGSTERTIKWHRHNIMQKLQVDTLAELVSLAERLRLVVDHDRPSPDED